MTTSGSGAVFFLGSRAHYQVLQQPGSRFDLENGNASTETIYQNPSVQEMWKKDNRGGDMDKFDNQVKDRGEWSYENEVNIMDEARLDDGGDLKRRVSLRSSEIALCEKETDIMPAMLNKTEDSPKPKSKPRRKLPLLGFLASLARRKKRIDTDPMQYLQHIESVLMSCTYRESCRCLECQSRYFECDDDSDDYYSDDSDYFPQYFSQSHNDIEYQLSEDDEVFVDTIPEDNTSTDLLIEKEKMSISSEEIENVGEERNLQLEVAAGTPVFLNYLLTHPITCAIQ